MNRPQRSFAASRLRTQSMPGACQETAVRPELHGAMSAETERLAASVNLR